MQKMTEIFKKAALAIIAAVFSTGCILEKYEASGLQNVMIQINVSADDLITKATEAPTSDEMKINTLRIYAFQGDRLCGYYYKGSAYDGPILMDLEIPDGVSYVDFYLIANETEMAYENGLVQLSENMTRAQLEAIKFTGLTERKSLPMYCRKLSEPIDANAVSTVGNTVPGHEGHLLISDPVTFTLERSLAKLSVYAAKIDGAANTPQIRYVSLLAQGTREYSYLFPQTDEVLDGVPHRANDRDVSSSVKDVTSSVVKGSSGAADPSNYTEIASGLYMPEVREGFSYDDPSYKWNTFIGSDADKARTAVLRVEYSLGADQELRIAYVYLPRVERNHHIKVCILINAEGQIIINYTVADWNWDENNMNDWFFDYPTHTFVWHSIPQSDADRHTKPASKAVMSETQPFKGYFQMTAPGSDSWTPTLEGLNASKCDIKVYEVGTDTPVTPPLAASEEWYRIEVIPKSGYMNPDETVNLAITYTPGGLTESEYLLINGSHQDYFWPSSTSENYITITMVN